MNKIVYIIVLIIFIAIIGAGFLALKQKEEIVINPTCLFKDNTCCKDVCSISNVTCEIGSKPQFKGCDADCEPIVECVKTAKDETVDWKVYQNKEYGFEMKYPDMINVAEGNVILNWESDKIVDLGFSIEFFDKDPNVSLEAFVSGTENLNSVWHYEHTKIILPSGVEAIRQTWMHQLSGTNYFINLSQTRVLAFRSIKPDTYKNEMPYFNQILSTFRFLE